MKAAGIVLAFTAYTVGTWGYVLVKGYNITLREWVSPLHPFTGPLSANGNVPLGSIFPTGKKGAAATGSKSSAAPGANTQPAPGSKAPGPFRSQ